MLPENLKSLRLSDRDLGFLVETVLPEITDKLRLKQIIAEDEDFRRKFISDEKILNAWTPVFVFELNMVSSFRIFNHQTQVSVTAFVFVHNLPCQVFLPQQIEQ